MGNDGDDKNDTVWSHPLTLETASKRQQLATTAGTLTLPPPPSRSSSSNPPGDSLLQMSPPLPTLPFELITDILCRLPINFLMTLKCVCKPWNSLISSDRSFAVKHLRISRMNPKLILKCKQWPDCSLILLPLRSFFTNGNGTIEGGTHINCPLNSEENSTDIVGSCDGILCLNLRKLPVMSENFIQAALWNPSIRKYNVLPALDKPNQNDVKEGYVDTSYGFGYDHSTDNYKVVVVFMYKCIGTIRYTVYKTQVMIHTLGTDSWRLIQDFPSIIFGASYLHSGKFVSGTINWLLPSGSTYSNTLLPIVSLDLGTESYQEILPPDYGEETVVLTLGVLRDCLCIVTRCVGHMVSDIWLMKVYGKRESWTKFVSVPHMGYSHYFSYINKVPYISEDDQMLLETTKMYQSELVAYDPINSTFKIQDVEYFEDLRLPEIYIESLMSPCS